MKHARRIITFILAVLIFTEGACAETIRISKSHFYQSEKQFELTDSCEVEEMAFGQSALGELRISSDVIQDANYSDAQSYIVSDGHAVSFTYTGYQENIAESLPITDWHMVSDGTRKIGDFDFGSGIKKGGILVQKSSDGEEWQTAYTNTNVFELHKDEFNNFYTAARSDLGNGCYYRVVIAYKMEKQTSQSNFIFFDTSSYDRRWHVEVYELFLISDQIEVESVSAEIDNEEQVTVGTGAIGFANQSTINQDAAIEWSLDSRTGGTGDHGFAAEHANMEAEVRAGNEVNYTGANNAANGPDYIVTKDGTITQIQCKYYQTPSGTIAACFKDGVFRYYTDTGIPMTIEVPADQYEKCVTLMQKRIANGQVPGVTDPNDAANIVKKGSVTYKQAVNLAKAGTIETLVYDAKTGCVTALSAFGISAVVQFAVSIWNNEPVDVALKNSLYTGLRIGGNAFVTSVVSSQLTRSGLNGLLIPGSQAIVRALGPKAAAVIANAARAGLKPIYGAAAMQSAARLIRGGVIVNTVSFLVFTIPDTVALFRGRISAKQLLKNASVTVGGIAGATAGGVGGAALGTAILPGIGTTIGGLVGGVLGGMGVSIGTDYVADLIAEDDADEMLDIINTEFQNLVEEYLLNQKEVTEIADDLQKSLNADKLKDMFASDDRHTYARGLIEPLAIEIAEKREKIVMPDEETISDALVDTLEEIYDTEIEPEPQE